MAMDKQTKNLIVIALVIGFVLYGRQILPLAVVGEEAPPAAVVTDGVTVYTGTPVLEWYAKDAIIGKGQTPAHFRVTINGSDQELLHDDTANLSLEDSYTVCLMPNSTYYGGCKSGTISKNVTKATIEVYKIADQPTVYINNDTENSTLRNAAAAPDDIGNDETMHPTLCIQGNGALKAFGPEGILVVVDQNTVVFDAVYFSLGTQVDITPRAHVYDANENILNSWELEGPLLNGETICGVLTFDGVATAPDAASVASPDITVMDKFLTRHSATDVLEYKYKRDVDGSDTNSATDGTGTYFLTS